MVMGLGHYQILTAPHTVVHGKVMELGERLMSLYQLIKCKDAHQIVGSYISYGYTYQQHMILIVPT